MKAQEITFEEFEKMACYSPVYIDIEDIVVRDEFDKEYETVDGIQDEINFLEKKITNEVMEEWHDSIKDAIEEYENEISFYKSLKIELSELKEKTEIDAIYEWSGSNKIFLGEKSFEIENLLLENRKTGGKLWMAIIEAHRDELDELLVRLDISSKRHSYDSGYDNIPKKGLTDDQVAELRTSVNKDIEAQDFGIGEKTKNQLKKMYDKLNQVTY